MTNEKTCKNCGQAVDKKAIVCTSCGVKIKKPIFKKWWFWVLVLFVIGIIATSNNNTSEVSNINQNNNEQITENATEVKEETTKIPTEYKSALKKAEIYSSTMHMSKKGIYNQLTSEYGEKFSAEAAQYAIDNLKADYNKNALEKAKLYQEMNMSPSAIHDQLTSEYGEKFTIEEADYAIANLE